MARYVRHIDGRNEPVIEYVNIAANQTIKVGDLIQINATSKKGEAAVAASTTLVGIAQKDITTGASVGAADRIPVTLLKNAVIRIDYIGTTKTTLAETDLYLTKFDLNDKKSVNLDDVTGGMVQVLEYNNTAKRLDCVFSAANLAY